MIAPRLAILLLAVPAAAQSAPPTLGEGAARVTDAPLQLDPRLAARTCLPDGFRYTWAGAALEARCPVTGERILLAVRQPEPAASRPKRGDSVQADFIGNGFRLSVSAVAEATSRDGQLVLRNSRSGARFAAGMDQSGRILVPNFAD